jgi:hypothetical protein
MKNICFALLLLFGCTSTARKEQANAVDTTAMTSTAEVATTELTDAAAEQATVEEESDSKEATYDSIDSTEPINLDRFAQYPLGYDDFESIVDYLTQSNIKHDIKDIGGTMQISFENSSINVLRAEAYGDLICSAQVDCRCYELGEGVRIGMSLANFLVRTSLIRDSLEGEDPMVYTRKAGGTNVGGTSTVRLYFVSEKLSSVEYGFDPCMIYD